MVLEYCRCNDDIPGVTELPAHIHQDFVVLLLVGDHPRAGETIRLNWRDWQLNLGHPNMEPIERIQELYIPIDWKTVARGIQG